MKLTNEAKVGLFTLIGLGLLVVVISFLGVFSFTSNGYNLNVELTLMVKNIMLDYQQVIKNLILV